MIAGDSDNMVEEISPPWAVSPSLVACLGERLAWKTGTEHVVGWDIFCGDIPNITDGPNPEVPLVKLPKPLIDLRGEDAVVPKATKGEMEST